MNDPLTKGLPLRPSISLMSIPLQFTSLSDSQEVTVWSDCLWILSQTCSLVTWSLHGMRSILQQHLTSMARNRLCSSAVRVHDSQSIEEDECDNRAERNVPVHPNWVSTMSVLLLSVLSCVCMCVCVFVRTRAMQPIAFKIK